MWPRKVSSARTTPTAPTAASYQRNCDGPRIIRVETKMHKAIATKNNSLTKNATRRRREVIKNVVQRISRPGELPRTKILLPALLVEIGEDEKQQARNESRE